MKALARFRWWIGVIALLFLAACQNNAAQSIPTATTFVSPSQPAAEAATATPTEAPSPTPTVEATTAPPPAPTATFTPAPPAGRIAGWVWEDHCTPDTDDNGTPVPGPYCQDTPFAGIIGDGQRQADEPALAGIVVTLSQGECPGTLMSKTVTNAEGYYQFSNLPAGTYCVSVDAEAPQNAPLLNPGVWSLPKIDEGADTVLLDDGGAAEVDFARTIKVSEVAQAQPTEAAGEGAGEGEGEGESAGEGEGEGGANAPAATPTPTEVPDAQKPYSLGEPDMHDPMDFPGEHWFLSVSPTWQGWVNYTTVPGSLVMQALKPSPNNYWVTSTYPPLEDAYLEVTFRTGTECARKDRYGVVVRGPDRYEGVVFLISCDGMYKIFRWNGGLKLLRNWTRTTAIHIGGKQINRIGVWMEGDSLKLYINHALVDEVTEPLFRKGNFALVIGSEATRNFEVRVDEVNYWILP